MSLHHASPAQLSLGAALLLSLLTGLLAAPAPRPPAADPAGPAAAAEPAPRAPAVEDPAEPPPAAAGGVADLAWLEGRWTGSDGGSDWESVYSSPAGGQIVSASKELRGGRTVMIDFEHFYERDGALRLTPFPFGRRSVEFTLTALDRDARRAVFENPAHDFPRRFEYARPAEDTLRIRLDGEQGGTPLTVALELRRPAAEAPPR